MRRTEKGLDFRIDKGGKLEYTDINAWNKRSTGYPDCRERAAGESPWRENGKWLGSSFAEGAVGKDVFRVKESSADR